MPLLNEYACGVQDEDRRAVTDQNTAGRLVGGFGSAPVPEPLKLSDLMMTVGRIAQLDDTDNRRFVNPTEPDGIKP